ncbi:Uncharacterised protein [Vibrio cholerae]|uniref:Uncharacterized protein n=1 Tax=Vibrio cholerae TaxID=666 RepID=A0A655ZTS6_VIBCL|nr:Uncharacterised protein [Vibrio cholerae]
MATEGFKSIRQLGLIMQATISHFIVQPSEKLHHSRTIANMTGTHACNFRVIFCRFRQEAWIRFVEQFSARIL